MQNIEMLSKKCWGIIKKEGADSSAPVSNQNYY